VRPDRACTHKMSHPNGFVTLLKAFLDSIFAISALLRRTV